MTKPFLCHKLVIAFAHQDGPSSLNHREGQRHEDNGTMFPALSEERQSTLLRLQSRLILDRFLEEVAGELAVLGYATRRSFFLSLTDKACSRRAGSALRRRLRRPSL
jgi:hypothetical protein